ncbi:hypothetical protein LSH36_1008g01012 [Paralvinella palmiformis]|uniref:EF-hand domain-containing protein n=1 Tax=Paralvinella palmiformis TaxID=53620 RepID=A0AAD9MSA1_9ANNE|nr:hypothetical protein LSH36_1008g01012 [Paralvinella palmiformis]
MSSKKEKKSKKKEKKTEEEEPQTEGGDDAPKEEPKRAQRATSNVFALFNQSQIQEFKEAFTMIDQNRDGIIDVSDLSAIYQQIGIEPNTKQIQEMLKESPKELNFTHFLTLFGEKLHGRDPDPATLKKMVDEAPGPLNFTTFLGLFGEKTKGTDPESALRDAFKLFDEDNKGVMPEEYVKDLLMNVGDQFSKDEIKQVWKEAPIEGGMMDYLKFVLLIKRGKEDE